MYYYYDVLLNFQDNNLYNFYEWEDSDDVDFVKKIPLFKVSNKTLRDILKYKVQFNKEFVKTIKNKTFLKNSHKSLENTFLICDSKDSIALELNDEGEVISRSKLLLSDEINLSEVMFTMKEVKLEYQKIGEYEKRNNIRQIEKIKKLINCEIDTLYKSNNVSKLKYLYYEWFNILNDNVDEIVKNMKKDLKHNFNSQQKLVYDLIKKSYHNVN